MHASQGYKHCCDAGKDAPKGIVFLGCTACPPSSCLAGLAGWRRSRQRLGSFLTICSQFSRWRRIWRRRRTQALLTKSPIVLEIPLSVIPKDDPASPWLPSPPATQGTEYIFVCNPKWRVTLRGSASKEVFWGGGGVGGPQPASDRSHRGTGP